MLPKLFLFILTESFTQGSGPATGYSQSFPGFSYFLWRLLKCLCARAPFYAIADYTKINLASLHRCIENAVVEKSEVSRTCNLSVDQDALLSAMPIDRTLTIIRVSNIFLVFAMSWPRWVLQLYEIRITKQCSSEHTSRTCFVHASTTTSSTPSNKQFQSLILCHTQLLNLSINLVSVTLLAIHSICKQSPSTLIVKKIETIICLVLSQYLLKSFCFHCPTRR